MKEIKNTTRKCRFNAADVVGVTFSAMVTVTFSSAIAILVTIRLWPLGADIVALCQFIVAWALAITAVIMAVKWHGFSKKLYSAKEVSAVAILPLYIITVAILAIAKVRDWSYSKNIWDILNDTANIYMFFGVASTLRVLSHYYAYRRKCKDYTYEIDFLAYCNTSEKKND